ncbi:hypothetical protein BDP55DRAFT_627564 [Colletotrichum godetiae]|uniref:Uncharacterized protein n=1 Tax=Colletotrichum godetiae TaxID=1209918 RepID=A0AAJ0AV03_9PEZI|nr:uncharacterized protein BDP55DRAFT_627564 [Colletotrichum godetiae]KAK1690877.1 hypothetical protein BDP55DRAFT_627564 [Colletotrichum godetiae]
MGQVTAGESEKEREKGRDQTIWAELEQGKQCPQVRLQAYSPCACPMKEAQKAPARVPEFLASACQSHTSGPLVRSAWAHTPPSHLPLQSAVLLVTFGHFGCGLGGREKKVSAAHSHVNEKSLRSLWLTWPGPLVGPLTLCPPLSDYGTYHLYLPYAEPPLYPACGWPVPTEGGTAWAG